jgi:DNA-binding IclR family transcriptional regulator
VIAAVSVAGPRPAILGARAERTRELLVDTCDRISRALGWNGA